MTLACGRLWFWKCLLIGLLFSTASTPSAAQVRITGVISDAESGETLIAAHIEVLGTGSGAISNSEGRFVISVPALPAVLQFRYIGYQTTAIEVTETTGALDVRLERETYVLDEIRVSSEDLARRVMRQVIERKRRQAGSLDWYQRNGYVRLTLSSRGEIQVISEHLFTDYVSSRQGTRVLARASSETSDIYKALGLDPLGQRVDLSDDRVTINDLSFIGPSHPDALDIYSFVLGSRRSLDGKTVYDIFVAPRNRVDATFIGTVSVLDEEFVIIEANLRPARHVQFQPPVKSWDVFYSQQFDAAVDSFWLPVDLRAEGRVHIDPEDFGYEPAELNLVSQVSEYSVNGLEVPDIFNVDQRVVVDSAFVLSAMPDLPGMNIVPLTPREAEALGYLTTTKTSLEDAFLDPKLSASRVQLEAARNPVDVTTVDWPVVYGYSPWVRFNRVDGFFLGAGQKMEFSPRLTVDVRAAQTTGFERIRFLGHATYRYANRWTFSGGYEANTRVLTNNSSYPAALTSLAPIVGRRDYFDYYWSKRFSSTATFSAKPARIALEASSESVNSAPVKQSKLWPLKDEFRPNANVERGRLNEIRLSINVGDTSNPMLLEPARRLAARIDVADSFFGSDYDQVTASVEAEMSFNTLFRRRPAPDLFRVLARGQSSSGDAPLFPGITIDGATGGFNSFGTLRTLRDRPYTADRSFAVFWEHQFTSLGLLLPTIGTRPAPSISIFGAHAGITGAAGVGGVNSWHHEMGLSLIEPLGLPLRFDAAYRLDQPGWYLGFGVTRLW